MLLITTDIGKVKVGDLILPGVFESLEISGSVKLDEVEIKGKKEKVTQAVGYDNARVRLSIILVPLADGDDCINQISQIQRVFRKSSEQEKPGTYRIVNKHVQARGINEVIFSDLRSYEDNRSDRVVVTCEFTEHVPIKVNIAKKSTTTTPAKKAATTKKPATQKAQPKKIASKTTKSPTKAKREPSLGQKILAWLRGKDV